MHNKLQIIYKHGQPYGIRDENGYLFFFREVSKFSGQEERYRQEVQESLALADYILEALKERANNSVQLTGATCPTHNEPVSDLIHYECGCSTTRPRN